MNGITARSGDEQPPIVGVVGAGVTGSAVGRALTRRGLRVAWFDQQFGVADHVARRLGGVAVDDLQDIEVADAVVLATPAPHAGLAARLLSAGVHVVCVSDDRDDVADLIGLAPLADEAGISLVVGAALSPGLTGLLARRLASQLAIVDEIHVAMHGTGGPDCARQHHDVLGSRSVAWHDGEWVERPGGSGRELCWFPEPVGAVDCYRAGLAEPLLLHRAFPSAQRISARVSATRRDRLTARLPMLTPPRRDGDIGAIRVEVRGALDSGERMTHIGGAAGRAGSLAGTVAGLFAEACAVGRIGPGLQVAGADTDAELTDWILARAVGLGLALHEFTGVARVSTW
jgi:hypothetical protein